MVTDEKGMMRFVLEGTSTQHTTTPPYAPGPNFTSTYPWGDREGVAPYVRSGSGAVDLQCLLALRECGVSLGVARRRKDCQEIGSEAVENGA
jgi:hypothetical protein